MNTTCMPNGEGKERAVHVAVVGGGAAGLMAAGTAQEAGASVTLYEPNRTLGRKLGITGKGRCNLTNLCSPADFLGNVTRNPRFLYGALNGFPPEETVRFFEERCGVPLKTERGRRVFPVSDRAGDIVAALSRYVSGCTWRREKVQELSLRDGRIAGVRTQTGEHRHDVVILATGGASYPLTGSDGSGYRLAASLGHTVTELCPSLVPLCSPDPVCAELAGLSLRNVALYILGPEGGRALYEDMGEMLFTHFGISGPMVLSASAHLRGKLPGFLTARIDLKPALDEGTLDRRLCADLAKYRNRDLVHAMEDLLPHSLILPFLRRASVDPHEKAHAVTRPERRRLLDTCKRFEIPINDFRPLAEAIVTSGGIDVREVDPRTMMSRLVPGLYFAGEILDVDAYTGGYNLQIAFSTGRSAGRAAAAYRPKKQQEEHNR